MYIAVVGDCHGQFYLMEKLLDEREALLGIKFDFVLQVGDAECHRDEYDLDSMACPSKYRKLGDFPDFNKGIAKFKRPIKYCGGNHENWGCLDQFPNGKEMAPNCTYLGRAGIKDLNGLKVAYLSGIYSESNYTDDKRGRLRGKHYEDASKKLFTYYFKSEVDYLLSKAKEGAVDILMLHEWPRLGFSTDLIGRRRIMKGVDPGSIPARQLVDVLRPQLVVAGHMHFRHRAMINNSQFAAMAIVAAGQDSIGVFNYEDGIIKEIE